MFFLRFLRPQQHFLKISSIPRPIGRVFLTSGAFFGAYSLKNVIKVAECQYKIRRLHAQFLQDPWLLVPTNYQNPIRDTEHFLIKLICFPIAVITTTWSFLRLSFRAITLIVRFVPLISIYPFTSRVDVLDRIWWSIMLWVLQRSGPTIIKLGQWASSRRDIFSNKFCDKLSILHTKTKPPRLFRNCDEVLMALFGDDIIKHKNEICPKIQPYSVGSGCIAHIYRLTMDMKALEMFTGLKVDGLEGLVEIAIKVADRGVEKQIETDLKVLRGFAKFGQLILPSLRFLDPIGSLDQFEMVLRRQVDLRNEGRALQRFARNFAHSKMRIEFPKVLAFNKWALAETFEEGEHFDMMLSENHIQNSRQCAAVRHKIAMIGAQGFLKMTFVDNFIHGDLHPGNILIRFNENEEDGIHHALPAETRIRRLIERMRSFLHLRGDPKLFFTNRDEWNDEPTLILLDAGIAISQTPEKIDKFKKMFKYIIENKGYEAGKFFLTYRSDLQTCEDQEAFCEEIGRLVEKARSQSFHQTINVTTIFNEMFGILWKHRVLIDSSFTSVMLSMMVLEGLGRALDPKLDLFKCAQPYLLNVLF